LPDWLQDDDDAEDFNEVIPVEDEEDGDIQIKTELPDWLQDEAEAEDEPVVDEDDLPGWLREVSEDATESTMSAGIEADDDVAVEGDLPNWLRESDDSEVASSDVDIEPILDASADESDALPDWLRDEQDDDDDLDAPISMDETELDEPDVDEGDLPDWLQDDELVVAETESVEFEDDFDDEAVELTEPLVDEDNSLDVVVTSAVVAAGVVASTSDSSTEAIESKPEPSKPKSAPVQVTPYDGDLPDWLRRLREVDQRTQETIQLGFLSIPVPVPVVAPILTPRTVQQTQVFHTTQPARPEPDSNSTEQLEVARAARDKGEIGPAVSTYEGLVIKGVYLGQVIDDMQQIARSDPSNYKLYQVLGDAMLRDGRIQSALEAYRQGLTAISL
jgi:hypothetical protein